MSAALASHWQLMADEFDPYREKLVVETITVWPEEYEGWDYSKRFTAESKLHAEPDKAAQLEYVRQHTGF